MNYSLFFPSGTFRSPTFCIVVGAHPFPAGKQSSSICKNVPRGKGEVQGIVGAMPRLGVQFLHPTLAYGQCRSKAAFLFASSPRRGIPFEAHFQLIPTT